MTNWAEYFREYRSGLREVKQDVQDNLRPHEVIQAGREVEPGRIMVLTKNGTPSQQSNFGKVYVVAKEHGWDVKCGASVFYTGDKLQANGKLVTGEEHEWFWLEGVKSPRHFMLNEINAVLDGEHMTAKELIERIRDEAEKEIS